MLSVCLLVCMGVFQTVQSDTATLSMERYSAGQTDCSLCAMVFGFSLPEMQNSSLRFMCEIAIWIESWRENRIFLVQTPLNIHRSVLLVFGEGTVCVFVCRSSCA